MKNKKNPSQIEIRLLILLTAVTLGLAACDQEFVELHDAPTADDSIIGGTEVKPSDEKNTYVAMLTARADNGGVAYCTATHISPNVIITAAHCVQSPDWRKLRVHYTLPDGRSDYRLIKRVVIPKEYGVKDRYGDLALMRIVGMAPSSQKIIPLNFEVREKDEFSILSIGFGVTNSKVKEGCWRASNPDCQRQGLGVLRSVTTTVMGYTFRGDEFYIDMRQGKGINSGDSGGPALYSSKGGVSIIGIARAIDTRMQGSYKYFDSYGYYTSVAAHKDWITRELADLSRL